MKSKEQIEQRLKEFKELYLEIKNKQVSEYFEQLINVLKWVLE